jgi:hypothetical protein
MVSLLRLKGYGGQAGVSVQVSGFPALQLPDNDRRSLYQLFMFSET